MLVKLPKLGSSRKVWLMNNGIPTDLFSVSHLGDWTGTAGEARYKAGYENMASSTLHELPLTTGSFEWDTTVSNQ